MKKLLLLLTLLLSSQILVISQKYDFKWLLGYSFTDNPLDTGFGSSFIDFDTPDGNPLFYESKYKIIDFQTSSANICDENGIYQFACNGGFVEGPDEKLMENSDSLADDIKYPEPGTLSSQAVLIIPYPGRPKQYIIFNKSHATVYPVYGIVHPELFYSVVDMSKNNGRGKLTVRHVYLLKDTLDDACLTATKHANGRDWWVIVSRGTEVGYYIFLVSPSGVALWRKQVFPEMKAGDEPGQSCFSNSGEYFVTAGVDPVIGWSKFYFFKFDRCDGTLYNFVFRRIFNFETLYPGCAFSPDNKYVYFATLDTLSQFEIKDGKLVDKKIVGIYDDYRERLTDNWYWKTRFGPMQQAPDGRIYCIIRIN